MSPTAPPPPPRPPVQAPLFPEHPLTLGNMEQLPLDRFPEDTLLEGPPPSAALVESIRRWGVLEPVLVRAVGGGVEYDNPRTLISGRRRLKALRRLHEEYRTQVRMLASRAPEGTLLSDETVPGYRAAYERMRDFGRVPVRVISDPEGVTGDGRTETLALTANAVRADNPVTDFRNLAALLARFVAQGLPEKEAVAEVAQATGLATGTIRQRLRLLQLSPELQEDFMAGRLPYAVALEAEPPGAGESGPAGADAGRRQRPHPDAGQAGQAGRRAGAPGQPAGRPAGARRSRAGSGPGTPGATWWPGRAPWPGTWRRSRCPSCRRPR